MNDNGSDNGQRQWGAELFWAEERWRALQAVRLAAHLRQAGRSGLYRGVVLPLDLEGEALLGAVRQLPLTTKDQLARAGREAWVQVENVAEWVCTSGTLGKPLDVPLTAEDVDRLGENEGVGLAMAGIGRGDLVVLAVGMERMFVAGLAYWLGARRIGAACVRVGPRVAEHPEVLRDLVERVRGDGQRVFVIGVPSFLVNAAVPGCGVEGMVAIGEPVKRGDGERGYNGLGGRLRERFGCPVMSTYAMTETCTTFAEGPACFGGHLNPALGMVEVLDDAGEAVAEGAVGEVVVTPLGVEGMPLLRFRTGDMAAVYRERCACGRTTPRVGPIVGRRQQLLKIKGVSVYPQAIIEAVRGGLSGVDCVVVTEEAESLSDRVTVFAAGAEAVRGEVEGRLRGVLRVVPEVRWVAVEELERMQRGSGRKAERFVDRRDQTG